MIEKEIKRTCIKPNCGNTFTCHGECETDNEFVFFDACFCPECAKKNPRKYSEELKQVCPRFKDIRKEKVVFT